MRNFALKLERYSERTGQPINWLYGNVYFYLPILFILHIIAIFFILSIFVFDIFSLSLCLYAGATIIVGFLTMITFKRVSTTGYYSIIIFSLLNAIRCLGVVCILLYSMIVSILYPPINVADAHMPVTFVAILFSILIAIEAVECAVHIGNIIYISKRKMLFKK